MAGPGWGWRRRPSDVDTRVTGPLRTALHYILAGDLSSAEVALAEAAKIDSSSADIYLALANLYRARGEIGRAIQIHQNLLLRHDLPDEFRREALLGLALDFRTGGFLRRAAASFEELLESEPKHATALRELERIRIESGDWEKAIRVRRRIGPGDPRSAQILAHLYTGLGRSAVKAGSEADARKSFRRALQYDRTCAEAYLELGDQQLREGKPRKAVGIWQRVLPLHPEIGLVTYARLWEGFQASSEIGSFEILLRQRLDAAPQDHEAAIWLARTLVYERKVDEALSLLRHRLDQAPDFLPAAAEVGRILLREKRDSDAIKVFEELLDRLPLERKRLTCANCGTQDTALHWRCPQCGEWDSF